MEFWILKWVRSQTKDCSTKMELKENKNGLKGQHILAQGNPGKTGRRPGLENGEKSRPRNDVHKRKNLISDEMEKAYFLKFMDLCFVPIRSLNSVRSYDIALINIFARTGFSLIILPQALPGARINWPFKPENKLQLLN